MFFFEDFSIAFTPILIPVSSSFLETIPEVKTIFSQNLQKSEKILMDFQVFTIEVYYQFILK